MVMENRAQAIVDDAHEQVRQWLQKADAEINELKAAAQRAGEKKGLEQADQFNQKLDVLRDTMNKELSLDIIQSAVEIARHLLLAEVEAHPDGILRIAQKVLSTVPEAKQIYLRVNPADAALLRENKERLINVLEKAKDVDIRVDKQVERGGLIVQTESGVIDAQLSTQIEEISRAIGGPYGQDH